MGRQWHRPVTNTEKVSEICSILYASSVKISKWQEKRVKRNTYTLWFEVRHFDFDSVSFPVKIKNGKVDWVLSTWYNSNEPSSKEYFTGMNEFNLA